MSSVKNASEGKEKKAEVKRTQVGQVSRRTVYNVQWSKDHASNSFVIESAHQSDTEVPPHLRDMWQPSLTRPIIRCVWENK